MTGNGARTRFSVGDILPLYRLLNARGLKINARESRIVKILNDDFSFVIMLCLLKPVSHRQQSIAME
jgi:hypothetical protein